MVVEERIDSRHKVILARGRGGRWRWTIVIGRPGEKVAYGPVRGFDTKEKALTAAASVLSSRCRSMRLIGVICGVVSGAIVAGAVAYLVLSGIWATPLY